MKLSQRTIYPIINIAFATVLLILIVSCSKSVNPVDTNGHTQPNLIYTDLQSSDSGMICVGEQLENPYSVANMQKAYDNLIESGTLSKDAITDNKLSATHHYIKIIPKNEEEYRLVCKDTSLVLFDYPLDRKISSGGTYYRDPTIRPGQPNFQYSVISVNKKMPSVKYVVLAEIVLDEKLSTSGLQKTFSSGLYQLIEAEALRLTGNLPTNTINGLPKLASWRPSGNIQVFDNYLNKNVPIYMANIRIVNWFKIYNGWTDVNGNFQSSISFSGNVSYSLKWQYVGNRFDIRSGTFGQAYYNGPSRSWSAWNLVISSGMSFVYAHSYRAGVLECALVAGRSQEILRVI